VYRSLCIFEVLASATIFVASALAQPPARQLPPVWPGETQLSRAEFAGQRVFITPSGDALMIRVPRDPGDPDGPQETRRVQLNNQLLPAVAARVSAFETATYQYNYTVLNANGAHDPIGTWALVVPLEDKDFRMTFLGGTAQWSAGRSTTASAPRAGLPVPQLGCFARWSVQESATRIMPGRELAGFQISSSSLPGLTTAYFSSGIWPKFQEEWPDSVFQQLSFRNNPAYRDKMEITIGPRFVPGTPISQVAQDYQLGLKQLIKDGRVDPDSAFLRAVLGALAEIVAPGSGVLAPINSKPNTRWEMELRSAIQISIPFLFGDRR
jgi:hypothetical protein